MKSSFKERLDEIDDKYGKPDKKKKKKKNQKYPSKPGGLNGVLHGFNQQQAKGDVKTTLLKTVADLAGVGLGTAVSAAAGRVAPLIGAALIGTGHYIGDDSGLLRVVGAATVAHSVAKSKEYSQEGITMKDRLSGLKDDWLCLAMLKHEEQKTATAVAPVPVTPAPVVKTEAKPKPNAKPEFIPTIPLTTERRKTPYELEIEQRQNELEEEAEQLRAEMEEHDFEREATGQKEIDMSELNAVEQSLYGTAKEYLKHGDFTAFDQFDDAESQNDDGVDSAEAEDDELTIAEPPHGDNHNQVGRMLWPPEPRSGKDDFLEDDDYNFNDY